MRVDTGANHDGPTDEHENMFNCIKSDAAQKKAKINRNIKLSQINAMPDTLNAPIFVSLLFLSIPLYTASWLWLR